MERLQNVVFPDGWLRDHPDLFYHRSEAIDRGVDGGFRKVIRLRFNSYMNAFALKKWRKYTDIGDLRLCLRFSGQAKVSIHGAWLHSYVSSETILLAEHDLASQGDEYVSIELPEPSNATMLYFEIDYEEGSDFKFHDAYFGTPTPATNAVKIAIVTCTYRREQYVLRSLERFRGFLKGDPDRRQAFEWYIIDNGQTLPREIDGENVHLIYNKNTGGAGGFARGMLESLRADKGFTHVLLMDDDVELFTESFARTLRLMRYVKATYRNAFVHASMFAITAPAVLFETSVVRDKLWVRPVHRNLKVRSFHNVLVNDCVPDDIFQTSDPNSFSPWWYCCMPIDSIESMGLPLPLFIRGDDVEYAWRQHGIHHIAINGICIWHESFDHRIKPTTDHYFLCRNMFIVNAIYQRDFETKFAGYFSEHFARILLQYDYPSAELVLSAMNDILRGADCLREDPKTTLDRLKVIPTYPRRKVGVWEQGQFRQFDPKIGQRHRLLDKLTLAGLLLPKFLFRREDGYCTGNLYPPPANFKLRRRVHVLNETTSECTTRVFDRWRAIRLGIRFLSLLWKMKRMYPRLCAEYKQTHRELTGIAFWERYLNLGAAQYPKASRHHEVAAA